MVTHPFINDPSANPETLIDSARFLAAHRAEDVGYRFGVEEETECLSYGELQQRALSIAVRLQAEAAVGDRVLLLYQPGLDFVAGLFGCVYAGCIAVPAYPPRLNRTHSRLHAVVADCEARVALSTSSHAQRISNQFAGLHVLATDQVTTARETEWKEPQLKSSSVALLQYTSGSTGTPKGVVLTHENLLTNAAAQAKAVFGSSEDRIVTWTPMFHDMGFMVGVVLPTWGVPMFGMPPTAFTQRPIRWLRAISNFRATVSGGPNFAYQLCVESISEEEKHTLDLSSWRVAFNGAEPVRAGTIEQFCRAFAPCGLKPEAMFPCYGLAEATLMVSVKQSRPTPVLMEVSEAALAQHRVADPTLGERSRVLVSSGSPLPGLDLVIAEPETSARCNDGEVGEILVRGPSVAHGYWGQVEESKRIFDASPDRDASPDSNKPGGFLRTGDLGFLNEGELFVTGRLKDLIIIRGVNHYPQDIETAAGRCHWGLIAESGAAFAVLNGSEERLVVVQEAARKLGETDQESAIDAIRRTVSEQFELQPLAIVLISPGTIPRTSSGKIQRHACKRQFLADELKVVKKRVQATQSALAPLALAGVQKHSDAIGRSKAEIETWLAARLAELLIADASTIDTGRPFAEYGLDSKDAVSISGELEKFLNRRLPADLLYEYPTIAALSGFLAADKGASYSAVDRNNSRSREPIAIVGLGGRFPGAEDISAYWRLLKGGVDAVSEVPSSRWPVDAFYDADPSKLGKANTRWGGFLSDVDLFDAAFFGISRREAEFMDPQQRLILEAAWDALQDAGMQRDVLVGAKGGTFIGISTNDYGRFAAEDFGAIGPYMATGNSSSIAANRLAYFFDWRGPSVAIDTACSSSLVAVDSACRSLWDGSCDFAIAGGVNLILSPALAINFSRAGLMAPDGRCKSFDASANGFVRSEGVGIAVLKPLREALAAGDRIYCVVRGTGVNQDGRSNGLMAPKRESQVALLRETYERSGMDRGAVTLIEAHGSGTLLGDSMELSALAEALGGTNGQSAKRFLGSVKSNIGHAEAAAGIAGLIKAALALHHGQIPPSVHYQNGNPHTPPEEFGFQVPTRLLNWPEEQPRTAGVSSFGFGGTNAHIILEAHDSPETPDPTEAQKEASEYLLPISGHSAEALRAQVSAYAAFLSDTHSPALDDICYTAGVRRAHHAHRAAFVGVKKEEIRAECERFVEGYKKSEAPIARGTKKRKRAFIFAGHGAQHASMGRTLFRQSAVFREVIESFAAVMEHHVSWSLTRLLAGEAVADWNQIDVIQPALLAIETGLAALWRSWGVEPDAVAGVSMGEIVAAHVSGVLSLEDAVRLTCARSRLLKKLPGGMLMTGLSAAQAEAFIRGRQFPDVSVGICSSPKSTVISGGKTSLANLQAALEGQGVFARPIDIPYASHSPAVDAIRDELWLTLAGVQAGTQRIPVYSTVTGNYAQVARWDAHHWWSNLRAPVLFSQVIEKLLQDGVDTVVEVSPHPVHCASISETVSYLQRDALVLPSLKRGQNELASMLSSAAKLYEAGDSLDWQRVVSGGRHVSLPAYSFERERFWLVPKEPGLKMKTDIPTATRGVVPEHHAPAVTAQSSAIAHASKPEISSRLRVLLGSLLGVSPDRIDIHAPFLEMGADSLILLSAVQGLEREFGIKLSIRQFFEQYTTLDSLADYLLATGVGSNSKPETQEPVAAAAVPPEPSHVNASPAAAGIERLLSEQLNLVSQTIAGQLQLLGQLGHSTNGIATPPAAAPRQEPRKDSVPPRDVSQSQPATPFIPYAPITPGAASGLNERQQAHLKSLSQRHVQKTGRSKQRTQEFRSVLADNRASAGFRYSVKEMLYPIHAERSSGSHIVDIDGNEYIDLTMGFGVNLFGHGAPFIAEALQRQIASGLQLGPQSPEAGEVARLICDFTGFDRVTFCNSGTEAVMMAIRLARTATSRNKLVIFAGSYHGTYDGVIARNDGSRLDASEPFAPGILPGAVEDVLVLEYGDPASLDTIRRHSHDLAAVLVEPVQSRRPDLQPKQFLQELREITRTANIALIFDEVITGFRIAPGGAQEWFGVRADLATYGKVIGGGMPIGVVAGTSQLMDGIDGGVWGYGDLSYPSAKTTFFAGTFCKHPLAMTAAKAVLNELRHQGPALQSDLNETTARLVGRLNALLDREAPQIRVVHCGSLFRFAYTGNLDLLFYHLLDNGLYIWEGRNCFLSTAHTEQDVDTIVRAVETSVHALQDGDFLPVIASGARTAIQATALQHEKLPLDDSQRQIWTASRSDPEASLAYHVPAALELAGALRRRDLQQAVELVIGRHHLLQSKIDEAGETWIRQPHLRATVAFSDLGRNSEACASEQEFEEELRRSIREPFDFANGPLLRATLFRLAEDRHMLLVVGHHIAVDGISIGILLDEIRQAYSAFATGSPLQLSPAPQFSALCSTREQRLQTSAMDDAERFWLQRLGPEPPVTDLPLDFTRPSVKTYGVWAKRASVSAESLSALKDVARQNSCSLFMTLFAAFGGYVHRLTDQTSLVVGIAAADRQTAEEQWIVANCTNVLPMALRFEPEELFTDLQRRLRSELLDAFDNAHYPFSQLVRKLSKVRDVSRSPLVDVVFNLDRVTAMQPWHELESKLIPLSSGSYPFDFHLNVIETASSLELELQANRDLFSEQTASSLVAKFGAFLDDIAGRADRPLAELELLETKDRELILREWNRTSRSYPSSYWIHEVISHQAKNTPEATALIFEDRHLTYRELDEAASRLANYLRHLGVRPEMRVGVCLERSLDLVIGLLAVLKAGGVYVPFDPDLPVDRLNYMLADSQASLLLTTSRLASKASVAGGQSVLMDEQRDEIDECATLAGEISLSGSSAAYAIYTSGSTGRPKCAVNTHAGILNRLQWMQEQFRLTACDRVLQKTPFSFDVSVWEFFWPLMVGATLVIAKPGGHQDPEYLADVIAREGVTTIHFVPSMLSAFLQFPVTERCSSLRQIVCSGEALSPAIASDCLQRLPAGLHNLYGPTEAAVDVTYFHCVDPEAATVPIGRPIANTQMYIVDRWLQPVSAGVVGELLIGGVGVGRGYLGRPDITAERFIPDPFSAVPGQRLYRTGDLARWNHDGTIAFIGRADYQVKVRGFRIELGEIETALLAHPAVAAAAVTSFTKEGGNSSLVAYIVASSRSDAAQSEIRQHLLERLPRYMVPDTYVFLSELPLTPSGKLDRKALPLATESLQASYVPPSGLLEEKLVEVWGSVLNAEQLGVQDNFFEAGGDSISALQIVARARQAGMALNVEDIFRHQTVAELARYIDGAKRGPVRSYRAGEGQAPLTPIQRWFFDRQFVHAEHWNQSVLLSVPQNVTVEALERAVRQLAEQHDALRLSFRLDESGDWVQEYLPQGRGVQFERMDVSKLDKSHQQIEFEETCDRLQSSAALEHGPLFRAACFEFGAEDRRLFLTAHHLVIDGVSWRILLDDLTLLCDSQAGTQPSLAVRTTSYGEWAQRLHNYALSQTLAAQLPYWQRLWSAGALLRRDRSEGINTVASASRVVAALDVDQTRELLASTTDSFRTDVFELLLTAVARTIADHNGVPNVLIDLEGHGRETGEIGIDGENADLSRTIGWFTSLYPIEINAGFGLGEDLDTVKRQLRSVPSRGIGYGVLKYLTPNGREALHSIPEPEVVFNYLGQFEDARDGWRAEWSSSERLRNAVQVRPHVLEIDAYLRGGQLHLTWEYSRNVHDESTVQRLLERCLKEIVDLTAYCLRVGRQPSSADFPLVQLSKPRLDAISLGRNLENILPATPIQQGMLFHSLWTNGHDVYVNQFGFSLEGDVEVELLRRSCEYVVQRHAVLRSCFTWSDSDEPVQVFEQSADLEWQLHDWRDTPCDDQSAELSLYLAADRARGIDLGRAPLIRMSLMQLAAQRYQLVWTHHHAILDGWSAALIWNDISLCYAALLAGEKLNLPQPSSPELYVRWLRSQNVADAQAFWTDLLRGYREPLQLGIENSLALEEDTSARTGRVTQHLSSDLKLALEDAAKARKVTLNTLLQFTWGLLLARYSGRDDVVFGVTNSGRPPALIGSDAMVGLFINTLPIRLSIDPTATVSDLLGSLQHTTAEMSRYQHCSLPDIHGWSDVPAGQPLFNHILVFENYPLSEANTAAPFRVSQGLTFEATNYPLTGVVTPGKQLVLDLLYDCRLYGAEAMKRLLHHWAQLLGELAGKADALASDLQVLCGMEREEVFARSVPPQRDSRLSGTISDLWKQQVAMRPEAIAVVYGQARLSYQELDRRSNCCADLLRQAGVRPGIAVGVSADRSLHAMVALLGVVKAGGLYVPLPPNYPPAQLSYMLGDSGAKVLLIEARHQGRIDPQDALRVVMDEEMEFLRGFDSGDLPYSGALCDPMYAIYTSGSTGKPKCAAVTQAGFLNLLNWYAAELSLSPADRMLVMSSLGFDFTQKNLFAPLLTGGSIVLAKPDYDPDYLRDLVEEHGMTIVSCTPTAFYPLVEACSPKEHEKLSSVQQVALGGEPISLSRLLEWPQARSGQTIIVNCYGPTECADISASYRIPQGTQDTRAGNVIGSILSGCEGYVLDNGLNPLPVGVAGELYIGGIGVGFGYIFKPDLTAERFIPHPFSDVPGSRLYRTGDVARWNEDGFLEYLGRKDHQAKVRGFRIELGEIESVVRQDERVREAVAVVDSDVLVCYIVPERLLDESEVSAIREVAASRLTPQMVPAAFIVLDKLPLSANGKLDRSSLPSFREQRAAHGYEAPCTAEEEILVGIWSKVLRVERVGVEDNFFELGGHSLLATQVISQARRVFAVDIPISAVFDRPTVRGLAQAIDQRKRVASLESPIVPIPEPSESEWFAQLESMPESELDALIAELSVEETETTASTFSLSAVRNGHGTAHR